MSERNGASGGRRNPSALTRLALEGSPDPRSEVAMAGSPECHHHASTARLPAIAVARENFLQLHQDCHQTPSSGSPEQCDVSSRPVVACAHLGRPHRHGTRAAYVKDRCRCLACTAANTVRSREIARAKAIGRWHPYTDIGPVRAHVARLRSANLGYRQIALAAGTSTGHIREIAATSTRSAGRPPITRIRGELANRILAIQPRASVSSPNAKIIAAGTCRRIQALIAIGWPLAELSARLRCRPKRLDAILHASLVTVRTARTVDHLYRTLWDQHPPISTPEQRDAVIAARRLAAAAHWAPPLAWDDIDADPAPVPSKCADPTFLDEIAVDRAVRGDHVELSDLTRAEQTEAVRRLTRLGRSIREIADQLATTERTVARRRTAGGQLRLN